MFRRYDLAGRLTGFSLGSDSRALSYDAAGRVVGLAAPNDADLSLVFGYDGLDRLTSAQRGSPVSSTLTYGYDLSGNRTSKTLANPSTSTTTYAIAAASNRLLNLTGAESKTFDYDNAGNTKTSGAVAYGYDAAGRLTSAGTSTYAYNALGQRVKKTVAGVTTWFVYDEQGHLLGEYDSAGKLIQETAWLGDMPVATLRLPQGASSGAASVFYVHADHLGTPRLVTRAADNKVMWQWESEPFGNTLPNQNPQGQGPFVYNLRFPGQYFDAETELAYNYFRDYDPGTGRYVQSDPIGLNGGSWSTYSYVDGNPVSYTDPTGKFIPNAVGAVGGAVFGGVAGFWYTVVTTAACDDDLTTADWSAVLENTLFGAATGAFTGATFGAGGAGGAALGGAVFGSDFGLLGGVLSNGIKGKRNHCGCSR